MAYIEAFFGHSREIWTLTILTFINRMGTMVLPFLTVYLTTVRNFSLQDAGWLAGAIGIGSFIGSFLGGKLSDKLGPRIVIIASMFLGGIFLISLQCANTFWEFWWLILFTSLTGDAYRPAMMAAVGDYSPPDRRSRSMALVRLAVNLGFSAAIALGGLIATNLGYKWLFWIDGTTCILAGIFFIFASMNWKKGEGDTEEESNEHATTGAIQPYMNRKYLLFLLATFLLGIVFIQWFHSIQVFMKTQWGFGEDKIGLLLAANGIIIALTEMPIIDQVEKRKKTFSATIWGLVLLGASVLPFLGEWAVPLSIFAMLLFTFGEILCLPLNSTSALNMSPPSLRGNYMSYYSMTWAAIVTVGPGMGLMIVDWIGYDWLWIILAFLMTLSIIMHLKLRW